MRGDKKGLPGRSGLPACLAAGAAIAAAVCALDVGLSLIHRQGLWLDPFRVRRAVRGLGDAIGSGRHQGCEQSGGL